MMNNQFMVDQLRGQPQSVGQTSFNPNLEYNQTAASPLQAAMKGASSYMDMSKLGMMGQLLRGGAGRMTQATTAPAIHEGVMNTIGGMAPMMGGVSFPGQEGGNATMMKAGGGLSFSMLPDSIKRIFQFGS